MTAQPLQFHKPKLILGVLLMQASQDLLFIASIEVPE
jgi:hypothetical protein